MTERDWLLCDEPQKMLEFVRGKASDRKLRLLGCACCRLIWHWIRDEQSRVAVETAERYADGLVDEDELRAAAEAAWSVNPGQADVPPALRELPYAAAEAAGTVTARTKSLVGAGGKVIETRLWSSVQDAVQAVLHVGARDNPEGRLQADQEQRIRGRVCGLIRCLLGDCIRPLRLSVTSLQWHDGLLVSMARRMYESGDFTEMPVLADVLEDAGCTDEAILSHCRGPGPHARGCHVLDAILAKS